MPMNLPDDTDDLVQEKRNLTREGEPIQISEDDKEKKARDSQRPGHN